MATTVNASLKLNEKFGHSDMGNGQSIQIEFVSANPTGPLHVGHGRGAAFGDAIGKILQANGYAVSKEYYINDAGRQMDILAASVWLRLHNCFDDKSFPESGYRGKYIIDIAKKLAEVHNISIDQIAKITTKNAKKLFQI